jgi:hypothetical protein
VKESPVLNALNGTGVDVGNIMVIEYTMSGVMLFVAGRYVPGDNVKS